MKKIMIFLTLLPFYVKTDHPVRHVNQVVLWGHKLHSHSHSYIHAGFKKAFEHMGFKTLWLDRNDNTKNIDFSHSLFITEGQVDQNIPIRDDSYYIIHNCTPDKYRHLLKNGHAIILQVYTHDCLKRNEPSLSFCFHYDLNQPIIYMPWATDLLPHEIDAIKSTLHSPLSKRKVVSFVGNISGGYQGNINEINEFKRACKDNNIPFEYGGATCRSMEENITLMQNAQLAPAIQGEWQCRQGYIPCRIFKNISYGAMGITNSETVYKLFDKKLIYNANTYQLYNDAQQALKSYTLNEQFALMDIVRDKHTYLNRIESLFSFFEMVDQYKKGSI